MNRKALENIWRMVDMDQNGTLDFGEFLCLMFLWPVIGKYDTIFTRGDNARIVSDAFASIQDLFCSYDKQNNFVLTYGQAHALMSEHLPQLVNLALPEENDKSVSCPRLLHALYAACCQHPRNNIPGKYLDMDKMALPVLLPSSKRTGPRSPFWLQLREAFMVIEGDFEALDADNNGFIDYAELTNGVQALQGEERLRILARLEYKFNKVDLDHSRSVDFYEYLHLALLMIQDGSYSDLRLDTSISPINTHSFTRIFSHGRAHRHTYTNTYARMLARYIEQVYHQAHTTRRPSLLREVFEKL